MIEAPDAADQQAAFCTVLCDEWARAGVTEAVVAPGSRSTPLIVALASQHRIRLHVVLDERSAGFVALGLGLATGRPAVVVTTSGTASVELHPSVVEASQAGVPMIAATADRPPELHDVGAPQTVEQRGLFGGAVRWSVEGGVAVSGAASSWRSLASRTVAEAVAGSHGPGPVHLNLPFREPLLGVSGGFSAGDGRDRGHAWHTADPRRTALPTGLVDWLASFAGRRGLVVAGQGAVPPGDTEGEQGRRLLEGAGALGWPVLADPRSGCRIDHDGVVSTADALLRIPELAEWIPEIVVRIGAPWASKVLGQWLAGLPAEVPQIQVDPWGRWADPDRTARALVTADPAGLLAAAGAHASRGVGATSWATAWCAVDRAAGAAIEEELGAAGPRGCSEPAIARAALAAVPPGGQLVVSSSMPVRDVEWFGAPRERVSVLSNRGANGIDGVLSTAIGAALAEGRSTIALLGDLAFLYDAGALLWASGREMSLTVVVVDNDGGGIFSFLPQATALADDTFERFWGTPHGLDLVAVASGYGVEAHRLEDRGSLDRFLASAGQPGLRLGVIAANRQENVVNHELVHRSVAQQVRAVVADPRGGSSGADQSRQ